MTPKAMFKAIKFQWQDILLLLAISCFTVVCIGGISYMGGESFDVSIGLAVVLTIIFVELIFFYVLVECKRGHKPNIWVSIIFLILLGVSIATIVMQKDTLNVTIEETSYEITLTKEKIIYFVCYVSMLLALVWVAFAIFPRRFNHIAFVSFVNYGIMTMCLGAIIYSAATEYMNFGPLFKAMFEGDINASFSLAPKSFAMNKNGFAIILLLGMMSAITNHAICKKWPLWIVVFVYYFAMILTLCRTAIFLGAVAILIYFIYRIIVTFKKHKIRNAIFLVLFAELALAVSLMIVASVKSEGELCKPIYLWVRLYKNNETFKSRITIWNHVFEIMKVDLWKSIILGRGFGTLNAYLAGTYPPTSMAYSIHNGYVALFGQGGVFYSVAFIGLFIASIVLIIVDFKKNVHVTFGLLLSLLVFLAYSVMESLYFLALLVMLFIIVAHKHYKKEAISA